MTMDRARTDRGRERLRRLLRFLLRSLGVLAALAVGGTISFWIGHRWILGSTSGMSYPELLQPRRATKVSFTSGDVDLYGELALPPGEGPHPAVVVVHGSGKARSRHYRWVEEALVPEGFAVLTYDKRGVARSGGTYTGIGPANSESALGDLSSDALAGVRFLRGRPEIDVRGIGLFGVSQAGWILPLAAARSKDVAFMVIVSGPAVTVGEEIYYSDLTGDDRGRPTDLADEEIARRLAADSGPRGFDPVPSLEKVSVPGLWILGGRDRSIPVPETVALLEKLIDDGKDFRVKVYPQADHGLRDPGGERIDYFPVVVAWLRERVLASSASS